MWQAPDCMWSKTRSFILIGGTLLFLALSFRAYRKAVTISDRLFDPRDFPEGYERAIHWDLANLSWTVNYNFRGSAPYRKAWLSVPLMGAVKTGGSEYFARKEAWQDISKSKQTP